MKRLIIFELIVLFLATTFESDSPPGWFQQVLPVNDQINDIFFIDSSTGWVVTNSNLSSSDSGYIMKTTDGGTNWSIQFKGIVSFNVVQFLDNNTGYAGAVDPVMKIYKTTNGGGNWFVTPSLLTGLTDIFFANVNTGWYCDPSGFGGIFKTVNGGINCQPQLGDTFSPKKLYFLNQDTGWFAGQSTRLYFTTNGGQVWNLQFTFGQQINDIYFFNGINGIVSSGFSYVTSNGGLNWTQTNDGGVKLSFISDSIGWAGSNFNRIMKTINGGNNWYRQTSPIFDNSSTSGIDTLNAWAGGTGLVHTSDGGGPFVGILQISAEVPTEYELYQNYPNPFNPVTKIKYSIMPTVGAVKHVKGQMPTVKIIIYDIQGKEVIKLVNEEQTPGTYIVDWNASSYPSGVYLYQLIVDNRAIDTKKMILLK